MRRKEERWGETLKTKEEKYGDAADGVKPKSRRGVKLFFGSVRLHSRFDTSRTIGKRFGFLLSPR